MTLTVAGRTTIKSQTSVGGFSPASLFLNNEQGVWYDPSDLSTMYQDSALTTPVTALEQPVGFLIDKSKGATLGPELIVNGGFDTNTVWGLAGNWSISGGKLVGAGATNWARQDNITVAGRWYRVSFEVSSYTGGHTIRICNSSGVALVSFYVAGGAPNTYNGYFLATGTSVIIEAATTPFSGTIDNFSIRELPGNHAYQSTSSNRPVLSARVNLLTYSEDFRNTAAAGSTRPWIWQNVAATYNSSTAPDGTLTANLVDDGTTAAVWHELSSGPFSIQSGVAYTVSAYVKDISRRYFNLSAYYASGGITYAGAIFDLQTGTITSGSSAWTLISTSMENVGNGWYKCSLTFSGTTNLSNTYFDFNPADSTTISTFGLCPTYTGSNKQLYIWGADLRVANQGVNLPAYQRVGAATYGTSTSSGVADYDATNFPYYLKFDGSNDYLVGSDANMPTGDLSIFSGSYTNTDSYGALISYGKAISGNSVALAYGPAATSYLLGVSQYGSFSGISNSINKTFVFSANRTGNNYSYRRNNGSSVSSDTMTSSTSVYGNNGLTIGSNNEAQSYNLKFNGLIYGLIIRGASSTAQQITSVENWLNQKTKAYN